MIIKKGMLIIEWEWYMKVIAGFFLGESKLPYNDPKKGAVAQAFFGLPIMIVRSMKDVDDELINHEKIHVIQALEMLYIPFWIMYAGHYLINLIEYKDPKIAYRNIVFENEAWTNDKNLNYLKERKLFSWKKYF